MDIRDAIGVSFSWSQFVKEMEKRGYTWKLNRKYPALKTPDMERYVRLRSLGKAMGRQRSGRRSCVQRSNRCMEKHRCSFQRGNLPDFKSCIFLICIGWECFSRSRNGFLMRSVPISENWISASGRWSFCKKRGSTPGKSWQHTGNLWRNRCFP